MFRRFFRPILKRTLYREGTIRTVLRGPCKGLRYRIFPEYGLSPIYGGWERKAQALMVKHVTARSIVYDVGANYGIHTLLMARLAAHGRIYAFEPVPRIFRSLEENVRLNDFPNVNCVSAALSSRTGTETFVLGHHDGAGHLHQANAVSGETLTVETIALDDFVYGSGNPPPNFMKIDVEGAESEVLLGGTRTLQQARPILLVDLHGHEQERSVGKLLSENKYVLYRTEDGQPVDFRADKWVVWDQVIAFP